MRLTRARLKLKEKGAAYPLLIGGFLLFLACAFLTQGCSTGPPPPSPGAPSGKTISFQVLLNPAGQVNTQFTSPANKTYLGTYLIVINTLNSALIGNQTVVTTSADTWTDYLQLNQVGWGRNHRIALPNSQQPQQWAGYQAITPGTISGSGFTIALSLPDQFLGNANMFNVSVITYISPASSPCDPSSSNISNCFPIDALGPTLSANHAVDNMSFNSSVSTTNSLSDSGGLGDWLLYPTDFPDLGSGPAFYQNFDLKSLTVVIQ